MSAVASFANQISAIVPWPGASVVTNGKPDAPPRGRQFPGVQRSGNCKRRDRSGSIIGGIPLWLKAEPSHETLLCISGKAMTHKL
jgi:hypothetical protein